MSKNCVIALWAAYRANTVFEHSVGSTGGSTNSALRRRGHPAQLRPMTAFRGDFNWSTQHFNLQPKME
jgi:hypothetical protein